MGKLYLINCRGGKFKCIPSGRKEENLGNGIWFSRDIKQITARKLVGKDNNSVVILKYSLQSFTMAHIEPILYEENIGKTVSKLHGWGFFSKISQNSLYVYVFSSITSCIKLSLPTKLVLNASCVASSLWWPGRFAQPKKKKKKDQWIMIMFNRGENEVAFQCTKDKEEERNY